VGRQARVLVRIAAAAAAADNDDPHC
jgi:hypothetical protein